MSYQQDAVREYTRTVGAEHPERAWILSPYDTWEANPFYTGPAVRHPEDDDGDGDDEPTDTCPHEWVYTGTAYGGDDDRWHGEGRCFCSLCGADGDG
jgi:hypothetical protein